VEEYATIAWSLASFIAGTGAGIWLTYRLSGGSGQRAPTPRTMFSWARGDVRIAEPTARNVAVRKVTDWEGAATVDTENRTLTFDLQDVNGLRRSLTYPASKIMQFYKCETPKRPEMGGDTVTYQQLLAIARHYAWVIPRGRGYQWSIAWATRERRLRLLSLMMTTPPRPE
jgi:hypothetical protein